MFKKNESYRQGELFGLTSSLTKKKDKMLANSVEHSFFTNIFPKIDESDFMVLYSSKKSRPNTPVNQLVGALILKHLYNWTYDELFRNLNFNILTRYAIGIRSVELDVFSEATIYNFQNKVMAYYVETGIDLLTRVFDSLTETQLDELGIKTDIQRGDSFLMGSNIFNYTRLQLLIEVLQRLFRCISTQEKQFFLDILSAYTKQTSGQYIYKIQKEDLPREFDKLANTYHSLYTELKSKYSKVSVFKMFERVYFEQFVVIEDKVEVVPSNQLGSSILLSPDDETATYRDKRSKKSKGYSGHISETANPENKLNLITEAVVVPNNVDDAAILESRLPVMIEKTPSLVEYHSDGSYGSPNVDRLMEEYSIIQVQSTIRGKKAGAKFTIQEQEPEQYFVSCEKGQKVKAQKASKGKKAWRYKAVFDYQKCTECPLSEVCNSNISGVKINRPKRTWYFSDEKIRLHKRQQNISKIPKERRKLRANVEATVKEVKRGIKDGKIRTRGIVKATAYLTLTSIAVNLTRIHKHLQYRHIPSTEIADCLTGKLEVCMREKINLEEHKCYLPMNPIFGFISRASA